jgi:NADH dehydrogenase
MLPRVVIVGGGFGGLHAARALARAPVDLLIIDRTNHHLFQPLLYQVALASLAPSDITAPIRWLVRRNAHARVILGNVSAIDPLDRTVRISDGGYEHYDYLILATGSRHAYFGHDEWSSDAPGLKSLDDALEIRRRFLLAFERAEVADEAHRRELLTFAIVGGGPTGVELAGMIPDVARAFRRDFRAFDPLSVRVLLLEGGPRILPSFPPMASTRAAHALRELGVEVRVNSIVTDISDHGVSTGEEFIPTRNVFWAAGNRASSLGVMLGAPVDSSGRVIVEPDLSVPGHPEIFVAGDLAVIRRSNGALVPGVAPAAIQMGRTAGRNVRRLVTGKPTRPFRYRNKGELATIGRHKAVANFGGVVFGGYAAWFLWLFVHIMYLVGFRNRLSVLLQWAYMYFTYRRGVRLIAGAEGGAASPGTGEWPRPGAHA